MQGFGDIAPRLMADLQRDYNLQPHQAAGIVGQLAHESGGFGSLQEQNPTVPGSRGGFGYAQWTGPRRREFENFAATNGLDPTSYEANYGNLRREFDATPEGSVLDLVRQQKDATGAGHAFTDGFLRPGVPNYASRDGWTARAAALAAGGADPGPQPAGFPNGGSLAGPRTAMPPAPKRGAGLPGITEPDGFMAGGPGAWLGMPNGVTSGGYDVGTAMQGVGTGLMAIDNPKGAAALASMQAKNDQGKFTVQRDPNTGTLFRIDNKSGRVDVVKDPAFQKPDPYADAFKKQDAEAQVKRRQGIFDAANGAREKIGTLDEMGRILSKPELYQGSGGEYVQQAKKIGASVFGMDFSGIADGDVVQALGNKFALELRDPKSGAGMPGALSDSDREFLRSMVPGVKLSQEANMRLIDIYKKVEQRKLDEADLAHQYSKSKGGMFDSEFDTWRDQQLKARQAAQQQQQQQPPANRPPLSTFSRTR